MRHIIVFGVLVSLVAIGSFQSVVTGFMAEQWLQGEETAQLVAVAQERMARLKRLDSLVKQRMDQRQHVIGDLIKGRITLLEAADWFRYLNESIPEVPSFYRQSFAGSSDSERLCRQVIHWVRQNWRDDGLSRDIDELAKRLEAELEANLKRGALVLPDVAG